MQVIRQLVIDTMRTKLERFGRANKLSFWGTNSFNYLCIN